MNSFIKYTSVVCILFCLPFIYILSFQPELVKEFSREYLNYRLTPTAETAAEATLSKWIPLLIKYKAPEDMVVFVKKQAVSCVENPFAYVSNLTSENTSNQLKSFAISNPFLSKLVPKNLFFYEEIKSHFAESYRNLLNSLRIFFISNFVGLLVTLYLQLKKSKKTFLNIPSYLMLISIAYSTSTFIDQSFFFDFIFNTHMGIWYPILLLFTFAKLMLKRRSKEFRDEVNDTIQETAENLLP